MPAAPAWHRGGNPLDNRRERGENGRKVRCRNGGRRRVGAGTALEGERSMQKALVGLGALAIAALAITSASAEGTLKIGLVMCYSGQFADTATQMDNAIKLFVEQNGDTVAGKKVEFIRKDTGGINPDVAKRLSQ